MRARLTRGFGGLSHLGYSRDTAGIQRSILDRFWRNRPKMKKAPLGGLPEGRRVPIKKVGHRFFNRAVADHIVNIGLNFGLEQQVDCPQCIRASIPAYRHGPAVLFAKLGKFSI